MKLAIAQVNPVIGDFQGNADLVLSYARKAAERGADLVVFPELCLCGYPPMDLLEQDGFVEANLAALRRVQREAPAGTGVVVGYVDRNRTGSGRPLANAAALLSDGAVLHVQAKTLLPTYDVFDEARYFEPARERGTVAFRGERIGIAICEDLWWDSPPLPGLRYPVDPAKDLLDAGATLVLCPSASPFEEGKPETRLGLIRRLGASAGVAVAYANTVGANDSLIFDGMSMAMARDGGLAAVGASFREDLILFDTAAPSGGAALDGEPRERLRRALVLGIADYARKCGFRRAHLGLSGGIDSALVAALAVEALGAENVDVFGMPSRYSSEGSVKDARELAGNLGLRFRLLPIEEPFRAFLSVLEPVFEGRGPDLTEENLQARIRGCLMMAYSNKRGSLLLTTGNKSELAVGYCTLYGDMCGGLAVIGDLLKTQVYGLCRHINGGKPVIPEAIFTKAPSAELRPDQTDQDSLPPYEVLDRILEGFLIRNRSAGEMAAEGMDIGLVRTVIRMVEKAEYKRRQAPPVLKVSPKAFGMGRRIPIARRFG